MYERKKDPERTFPSRVILSAGERFVDREYQILSSSRVSWPCSGQRGQMTSLDTMFGPLWPEKA